jgi:hypothetical protein
MRANWTELQRGDIHPQAAGISVSMNPKGWIAMSRATHQKMGEPEAFVVFFDATNQRIGLKSATKTTRNAYPAVKVNGAASGRRRIHAYRLIREERIDLDQTVTFPDADIDEEDILVLNLRTTKISKRVLNHFRNKGRNREQ